MPTYAKLNTVLRTSRTCGVRIVCAKKGIKASKQNSLELRKCYCRNSNYFVPFFPYRPQKNSRVNQGCQTGCKQENSKSFDRKEDHTEWKVVQEVLPYRSF